MNSGEASPAHTLQSLAAADASPFQETWTVGQVGRVLGMSRGRVYWMFRRGELSGYQLQARAWVRIWPDSVREYATRMEAIERYAKGWRARHGR